MYYEKTDQATLSRTWNLSDDLGQIEYIFSDKTGTLTQNQMLFRQCSVGGKAYRGEDGEEEEIATKYEGSSSSIEVDVRLSKASSRSGSAPESASGSNSRPNTGDQTLKTEHPSPVTPSSAPTSTDILAKPNPSQTKGVKLSDGVKKFRDPNLKADLAAEKAEELDLQSSPFFSHLNGFWTTLALCHTVLTSVDPETGSIEYRAQSPDEAALVQAAADVGFVFRGREREILSLTTPFTPEGEVERWELMNVLEFTSARKRMSVVVRIGREDNIIIIRGGGREGDRPVYSQMLGAVDEFFPQSGILDEEPVQRNIKSEANPDGMYALQRINTGVASIVGRDNGDRAGGFVLVIDGAALNAVSWFSDTSCCSSCILITISIGSKRRNS